MTVGLAAVLVALEIWLAAIGRGTYRSAIIVMLAIAVAGWAVNLYLYRR